ncbi:lactate/malate family dehydrogenase [Marinactinospora thermotolerans]|uniref:Malate dehydrogenase (NAD) n=1 Tax=Marinactinospora thermotolerans DSM 45154 TaxID=1122192 RepID=A0A1T4RA21_9ACTN|nr:lactate dehydrogenase [Marinactinospora thermotolerans]SKA12777.1 malate dehydrogenase (NAD) [Marinactinospora thermotolerans DSM 45154]
MKVAVVGAGKVGAMVAVGLVYHGIAREIVLVDQDTARARGVALDLGYAAPMYPEVDVRAGTTDDLAGAGVVVVTAGLNEKAGGATDRSDPRGRLRLLDHNAGVFRDVVPAIAAAAPSATVMVITDPPDPLADLARSILGHDRVFSTGTVIDSLRFRVRLAHALGVTPRSVHAQIIGEHGTSGVFLWSTAAVGGVPALHLAERAGHDVDRFRAEVERAVRYANIDIIEGTGASRYGIGAVAAMLVRCVARDERTVLPVASHRPAWGTTLSLPSVLGAGGVREVIEPAMDDAERAALEASARTLREAASTVLV